MKTNNPTPLPEKKKEDKYNYQGMMGYGTLTPPQNAKEYKKIAKAVKNGFDMTKKYSQNEEWEMRLEQIIGNVPRKELRKHLYRLINSTLSLQLKEIGKKVKVAKQINFENMVAGEGNGIENFDEAIDWFLSLINQKKI